MSAVVLSLGLASVGCKKEAPTSVAPASSSVDARPAASARMLDRVPSGTQHFVVARDPAAVHRIIDTLAATANPETFDALRPTFGQRTDAYARMLDLVLGIGDELLRAEVDVGQGIVFLEDENVWIFGMSGDDPSALKKAMRAGGIREVKLPNTCVALPSMPGFAACGANESMLLALTPGGRGAALLDELQTNLPSVELSKASVVMRTSSDAGPIFAAVEATPRELHFAMGSQAVSSQFFNADYFSVGEAPALSMFDPYSALLWARVSFSNLGPILGDVPAVAQDVYDSMTGEVFVGGMQGGGLAALVGVSDPQPAAALVSLGSLQLDKIAAAGPKGTTAEARMLEFGGQTAPSLYFTMDVGKGGALLEAASVTPEAHAFAAGPYAGVVAGADTTAAVRVASHEGTSPTRAIEGLPPAWGRAFVEQNVAVAMHLCLDGLLSEGLKSTVLAGLDEAEDTEFKSQVGGLTTLLSPVSSVSWWVSHLEEGGVVHFSVRSFADQATPEGADARAALDTGAAGGDVRAAYTTLAQRYPDSPRAHAYRLRAGLERESIGAAAMLAAVILGGGWGVLSTISEGLR